MPATKESKFEKDLFHTIESAQGMVVDGVKELSERVAEFSPDELPEPEEVWGKSFDIVERLIENQRKFGLALIEAMTPEEKVA